MDLVDIGAAMAAVVVVAGWLTSPRFFILVAPLAFLVAVESLDVVARLLSRLVAEPRRQRVHTVLTGAAVVVCAVALAFGLPRYYRIPAPAYPAYYAPPVRYVYAPPPRARYYDHRYGYRDYRDHRRWDRDRDHRRDRGRHRDRHRGW